ncbi:hypothetical protein [Coprococcus comes]|uniref:hypothetical protein n=1 Tax=Coprococcus comes TaxID=410072 RepID=UPI00321B8CA6
MNIRCESGQVIIDFSTRETSLEVLSLAVKHQKALVCGTTGFSPEEMQQFQDATTLIPMLYTANTSKLVKYNEQASKTGHFHTKKECASAHSRAERGRLRHSSSSCKCASPARSSLFAQQFSIIIVQTPALRSFFLSSSSFISSF